MQAAEALGNAAQIAVTIAGFTGVAVVLGSGPVHQWPNLDRFRLAFLLTQSIFALAFCLIGLLLLATGLPQPFMWRWSSGLAAMAMIGIGAAMSQSYRRVSKAELNIDGWGTLVFSLVGTTQFGIFALLIYNAFALCAFWPFFAAIVAAILIATLQFVRLLFSERRSTD
jgi:hypothetical protein